MGNVVANSADTGLEVIDLIDDASFAERRLHVRDVAMQMEGMKRLASAFVDRPETILQELVNAAVDLCGAESAGISLELEDGTEENYYQWVATAGQYRGFQNAKLPRNPSACGMCLERGRPQLFRVTQRFFDIMGVEAPVVKDGILIPWEVEGTRGTIWIMAHDSDMAFDRSDCQMMETLANFAAMGVRQQRQQKLLREQAMATAVAGMANNLAHQINNPLQSLTNLVFLARQGSELPGLADTMGENVERLSVLVNQLLSLPRPTAEN